MVFTVRRVGRREEVAVGTEKRLLRCGDSFISWSGGGHTGVITCVSWLVLVPLHCEGLLAPLQARLCGQVTEHSVPLCPGESSNREQNYSAGEKLTQPLY